MSSAPTQAPTFAAGRYVLRERLGEGAVGEVWSAEDPKIGRRVAVKFLRLPEGLDAAARTEWERRFLLEARAAGRLSHPGIVSIHDVGTASDGRPYLVLELVDGRTLDALRRADPPPSLEQAVRWTIDVAEALDAAHRRGVVHRDVKPANVLVGADGRARIADFGIARLDESHLTRDGAFLGSPAFAAPEQLRGKPIDARVDLFSLGAVLYLLATGRRPFEGQDIGAIAYAVCHAEPPRPSSIRPEIGPALEAAILRALRKAPDERFRTAGEFAAALRAAVVEGDAPERTVRALAPRAPAVTPTPAPTAPSTAEDRAASIASATAIAAVRAGRAIAAASRTLWAMLVAWLGRTAPRVRRALAGIAAESSSVRLGTSRLWAAAALTTAIVLLALAGHAWLGGDPAPPHKGFVEQFREIVGSKTSRVDVVVDHGVEDGVLKLSENGNVLERVPLQAGEKGLFGTSFLARRSGTATASLRLAPGHHALTIAVTSKDGLDLSKTIDVRVDPRSVYDLQVSVGTWPWKWIGTDWDRVEE